jgi:hypothetical protein
MMMVMAGGDSRSVGKPKRRASETGTSGGWLFFAVVCHVACHSHESHLALYQLIRSQRCSWTLASRRSDRPKPTLLARSVLSC